MIHIYNSFGNIFFLISYVVAVNKYISMPNDSRRSSKKIRSHDKIILVLAFSLRQQQGYVADATGFRKRT